jgi:hypothetical protein
MNFFKNANPADIYGAMRGQVLALQPTPRIPETLSGQRVIAAVVDQNVGSGTATLACVADGSTSLYYSNGGGELGLGHAHPGVREATRAFLAGAGALCTLLERSVDYPLPAPGQAAVHLITGEGVFRQVFDLDRIETYSDGLRELEGLYEGVLAAIRKAKGDAAE